MTPDVSASTGAHRLALRAVLTHTVGVPPALRRAGTLAEAGPRLGQSTAPPAAGEAEASPPSGPRYREVFYVTGGLPGGYALRYALPVVVEIEAGEYVAVQPQLALHAFGETPVDAILSLREELVEHYTALLKAGDRLSPRLARQRDAMRQLLTLPAPDA